MIETADIEIKPKHQAMEDLMIGLIHLEIAFTKSDKTVADSRIYIEGKKGILNQACDNRLSLKDMIMAMTRVTELVENVQKEFNQDQEV